MHYQMPWPAIKACEVGLLHAGVAYRVGRTRRPHNLFVILYRVKKVKPYSFSILVKSFDVSW